MKKIMELVESSRKVILDCMLSNGALVAANSDKRDYPKEAKYYRYVWPRDAMFTCIAARILGLNIHEKFFNWCTKAEGWDKTGLFYEKYHPNGRKAAFHFQPDQTGSVLIAVYDHCTANEADPVRYRKLILGCADGLCRAWDQDHFRIVSQDLWEERLCFPDLKGNFSYSAAMCARGLECADMMIPNSRWKKASEEMRKCVVGSSGEHFFRSFGRIDDRRVDASLLGLVWPAGVVGVFEKRMRNTVKLIEERIVKDHGVYRYEGDDYDGWMYKGDVQRKKGAGYWPLLNFWMCIYHLKAGNSRRAKKYYDKVLLNMKGKKYIPEQIFGNDIQVSVSPLCWSHSMFVIASWMLGYV